MFKESSFEPARNDKWVQFLPQLIVLRGKNSRNVCY